MPSTGFIALLVLAAILLPTGEARALTKHDILAASHARIEQYRKADATVRVIDPRGRPVAGAQVQVRQVRHAFLFGCNAFHVLSYKDPAQEAAYEREFAALFNYATLPFYWSTYPSPLKGEGRLCRRAKPWGHKQACFAKAPTPRLRSQRATQPRACAPRASSPPRVGQELAPAHLACCMLSWSSASLLIIRAQASWCPTRARLIAAVAPTRGGCASPGASAASPRAPRAARSWCRRSTGDSAARRPTACPRPDRR